MAAGSAAPVRLFLDTGVIIEGCFSTWGASKAVLILATVQSSFTVVLAEAVERELARAVARKTAALAPGDAVAVAASLAGWLDRVRIERRLMPTADDLRAYAHTFLPALRHANDLPPLVTAVLARPDWVLSTNTAHWNARVAERTGLRIATPLAFLRQLRPGEQA
jgi:hypothetical protein